MGGGASKRGKKATGTAVIGPAGPAKGRGAVATSEDKKASTPVASPVAASAASVQASPAKSPAKSPARSLAAAEEHATSVSRSPQAAGALRVAADCEATGGAGEVWCDAPPQQEQDLAAACRNGNAALAGALAATLAGHQGTPVGPEGDAVIHLAARAGHGAVVGTLLGAGLSANAANAAGDTPIHIACRLGHDEVVAPLLNASADIGLRDGSGALPIHVAAIGGAAGGGLFDALLAARADIGATDSRGMTALHLAAARGTTCMQELLLVRGADPNAATGNGTTPLMVALKMGHLESVDYLLQVGANPAAPDAAGCTALAQALSQGDLRGAERLLAAGASVDAVDGAGRGAVFHAVVGGDAACLATVIAHGGRVNTLDEEGRTPLYQACLLGAEELVDQLLAAGADPNLAGMSQLVRPPPPLMRGEVASDDPLHRTEEEASRLILEEARTCAQVAALLGHTGILARVLDARCDIDAAPGTLGWTALHICAVVGNADCAALLLDRGAETSFEDAEGNTAEALAERAGEVSQAVRERIRAADAPAAGEEGAEAVPGDAGAAADASAEGDAGAASEAQAKPTAASVLGPLPPLPGRRGSAANKSERERRGGRAAQQPTEEAPAEKPKALAAFEAEWVRRDIDETSLLDRVFGAMVHDALRSEQSKTRAEALTYIAEHHAEATASPSDRLEATCIAVVGAAKDRVSRVQLAAASALGELLPDARLDELSTEVCTALLCGRSAGTVAGGEDAAAGGAGSQDAGAVAALLDLGEVSGKPSVPRAAIDTLCACVRHKRLPLDEAAWPLLQRIDSSLREEGRDEAARDAAGKKTSDGQHKVLAADLKLLCHLLTEFGLQHSGLFRRALLLPLLLRGASSAHSRVRSAAGEGLARLVTLSGGLQEHIWAVIPEKARAAARKAAAGEENNEVSGGGRCEEDVITKASLIAEDPRAGALDCVAELVDVQAQDSIGSLAQSGAAGGREVADPFPLLQSKNWKDRAQGVSALLRRLNATKVGADQVLGSIGRCPEGVGCATLMQYALCGHPLSAWGAALRALMGDTVTAVFVPSAELLGLACARAGGIAGDALLRTVLPTLLARITDSSARVRSKVIETALTLAALDEGTYGAPVVRHLCAGFSEGREQERGARSRLDLIGQIVAQGGPRAAREGIGGWSDETWENVEKCAVKGGEHRSSDVRGAAAALLEALREVGGRAAEASERASGVLRELAQQKVCKRPGTGARPPTGAGAGAGSSRPGTMARLATAASRSGSGAGGRPPSRCGTASNLVGAMGNYGRTKRTRTAQKRQEPESDDSAPECESEPTGKAATGGVGAGANGEEEGGVVFFDVRTSGPGGGASVVPDLEEANANFAEMLQLAEPLGAEAADFVAPLVAVFGDDWTKCLYSRQWQCRAAALTQLAASAGDRLRDVEASGAGELESQRLVDGAMRAVHEGLGDHNLRVFEAACEAAASVVPALCGAVDGRFLVAHLAPLLRQLCARMGDSKEVVRSLTCHTLFLLMRPPSNEIVSPGAVAALVLSHLAPKPEAPSVAGGVVSAPNRVSNASGAGGTVVGWLCRIFALRDLVKQYPAAAMQQQHSFTDPGEWLRLRAGLEHPDPTVRHESARLFALVCKVVAKSLEGESSQLEAREAWVAALGGGTVSAKAIAQVRKLLKLPEKKDSAEAAPAAPTGLNMTLAAPWDVPKGLALWADCDHSVLLPLKSPSADDAEAVLAALKALKAGLVRASSRPAGDLRAPGEVFADLCRAIQQALGSPVGGERAVLLGSVDLCGAVVAQLAPVLSSLDLNLSLGKTIQVILGRTSSSSSASGVKAAVASDRLIRQLAQHPKVGCEAAAKMVVGAVARAERPARPLMLVGTLIADHGLRLCAQRDFVLQLLQAVAAQLERLEALQRQSGKSASADGEAEREIFTTRSQLVEVLGKCNQFSPETVQECMAEVDASSRAALAAALRQAPNPELVALGAAASEQAALDSRATASGSASRALGRRRTKDLQAAAAAAAAAGAADGIGGMSSVSSAVNLRGGLAPLQLRSLESQPPAGPALRACQSLGALPRPIASITESAPRASRRTRTGEVPAGMQNPEDVARQSGASLISEVSTVASTSCVSRATASPADSPGASPRFGNAGAVTADLGCQPGIFRFRSEPAMAEAALSPSKPRRLQRTCSEARLHKGRGGGGCRERDPGFSPMDILRQVEGRANRIRNAR